jgi:hypothetical protein
MAVSLVFLIRDSDFIQHSYSTDLRVSKLTNIHEPSFNLDGTTFFADFVTVMKHIISMVGAVRRELRCATVGN